MKKLLLLSALLNCRLIGDRILPQSYNLNPNLQVNNNNSQTIEQNITISLDKPKLSDCTHLQGTPLKECMACQTKESFRQNMKALSDHTALAYWKSLDLKEYAEGLSNFDDQQWLEFCKSRKPENQKLFVPTLQILKRRIKLLYVNAYYYWIGSYLYSGQDHDKVDDLNEFIQTYESSLSYGTIFPFKDLQMHMNFQTVKNNSFGEHVKYSYYEQKRH